MKNSVHNQSDQLSNIFSKKYYESVCDLGCIYVSELIIRVLKLSGAWKLMSENSASASELVKVLGFMPNRMYTFEWLLRFLANSGYLKVKLRDNIKEFRINRDGNSELIDELRKKIFEIDPNLEASCEYMEYIAGYYNEYLWGNMSGYEILFVKDKMRLWNRYFCNTNSGYAVYNQLGLLGFQRWAPDISDSINMLEIGSGTGNAGLLILTELNNQSDITNVKSYTLSDVSPMFLRMGKRNILENYQGVIPITTLKLDFNLEFNEQNILPDCYNLIYGVNSLHVARKLLFSVKQLHEILKPGGILVVSECIRDSENHTLLQEFIFNLLESYTDVEVDGIYRAQPGFLCLKEWIKVFEAAGFNNIDYILNSGHTCNKKSNNPVHAMVLKGEK